MECATHGLGVGDDPRESPVERRLGHRLGTIQLTDVLREETLRYLVRQQEVYVWHNRHFPAAGAPKTISVQREPWHAVEHECTHEGNGFNLALLHTDASLRSTDVRNCRRVEMITKSSFTKDERIRGVHVCACVSVCLCVRLCVSVCERDRDNNTAR